jgi:hypothetical protein
MIASIRRVSINAVEISDGTSSVYISNEDLAGLSSDLRKEVENEARREKGEPICNCGKSYARNSELHAESCEMYESN